MAADQAAEVRPAGTGLPARWPPSEGRREARAWPGRPHGRRGRAGAGTGSGTGFA